MKSAVLQKLKHALIASVQASQGEPLNKPEHILALAQSCLNGGAKGLRLANPENISLVKQYLPEIPVIGITKPTHLPSEPEKHVYITPSLWAAESVIQAGADIVALDATDRPRQPGESLKEIAEVIKERFPNVLLMADIARFEDAAPLMALGFDILSTTLSGYTSETKGLVPSDSPDFRLLETLAEKYPLPIILEGRVWEPSHIEKGFHAGAYAIVVGSAITRPQLITQRFAQAIPQTLSIASG